MGQGDHTSNLPTFNSNRLYQVHASSMGWRWVLERGGGGGGSDLKMYKVQRIHCVTAISLGHVASSCRIFPGFLLPFWTHHLHVHEDISCSARTNGWTPNFSQQKEKRMWVPSCIRGSSFSSFLLFDNKWLNCWMPDDQPPCWIFAQASS